MGKADPKGCKAEIVHDFMQGTMHEIRRMNQLCPKQEKRLLPTQSLAKLKS